MGLQSACPISRALMDHWAELFIKEVEKSQALHTINPVLFADFRIHLLAKHVDNILVALEKMRKDTRLYRIQKAFIWSQEAYQEDK